MKSPAKKEEFSKYLWTSVSDKEECDRQLAIRDAEEKIKNKCPLCKGTRDRQAEICRECYDKKRKNGR